MEGYFRLYQNQSWTECQLVKEYNDHYHEENNLVMSFLKVVNPETQLIGRTISEIKEDYKTFAGDEYVANASTKALRQGMWELYQIGLGIKYVNGRSSRVCMRQEDTAQNIKP